MERLTFAFMDQFQKFFFLLKARTKWVSRDKIFTPAGETHVSHISIIQHQCRKAKHFSFIGQWTYKWEGFFFAKEGVQSFSRGLKVEKKPTDLDVMKCQQWRSSLERTKVEHGQGTRAAAFEKAFFFLFFRWRSRQKTPYCMPSMKNSSRLSRCC